MACTQASGRPAMAWRMAWACARGRLPQAEGGKAVPRLEVQVEAGGVHVVAGGHVAEVDAGVGLVGRLVLGEPRVALDAEQRPAQRSGVGGEVAADGEEGLGQVLDESQGRKAHQVLVALPDWP